MLTALEIDCDRLQENYKTNELLKDAMLNRTSVCLMNFSSSCAARLSTAFKEMKNSEVKFLTVAFSARSKGKNLNVLSDFLTAGNLLNTDCLALHNNSSPSPLMLPHLPQLLRLQACDMTLTGKIPVSIGSLLQLQVLSLSNNQLTGSIPDSVGSLLQLQHLNLSNRIYT